MLLQMYSAEHVIQILSHLAEMAGDKWRHWRADCRFPVVAVVVTSLNDVISGQTDEAFGTVAFVCFRFGPAHFSFFWLHCGFQTWPFFLLIIPTSGLYQLNFRCHFYASANIVAWGIMFLECSCMRACVVFEREYLWNGWRYRQAVNSVINYSPSHIEQKNYGELLSTNNDG